MNLFKKKYSLSILILFELACFVVLIFATVYVLKRQNLTNEQLNIAINLRYTSYLLADQLRQSSDDLTRMVRTYAATRESKFKEYFYMILNIREGKVPRPENYDRIFWDFKLAEETKYSSEDGERISLNTLMKKAGFSDEEFELLAEAKRRSDKLVKMEEIAMNAMKGKFKDDKGIFTLMKEPDRELAIQILFNKEYHLAKKDIMKPINDFLIAIDNRTSHTLTEAQKKIRSLSLALIYMFCFVVIFVPIFIFTGYRYRRISEVELRKSEKRYRDLYESAPNAYFSVNPVNGSILRCNLATSHLLGFDKETILQMKVFDFYADTPHGLPKAQVTFKRFKAGETIRDVELQMKHMDGNLIWISLSVDALKDDKGNVKESPSMVIDITERRQAEEALRESEERYRTLFEDNPIETIVVDKDARIEMYNKAKKTSGDRLPHIGDVMYKDYAASHLTNMHQELMECIQLGKSRDFPDQNYRSKFLDIRMFPFEKGAIITSVDRTEKKNLERKLRRTQKMESLGLMAGGIAHDLNNILSGIVSYPELLLMALSDDSPHRKHIEAIKESGMRAADVVADLLTIARGVATGKDILNLNTMIEECLSSAEHHELKTMHSLITFKTDLDSDLLNISCSSTHITKSLTNLITNASEAIEGSGTVSISTMNRYLDEPLKGYEDIKRGEYVVLSVSDDGSGISAADLERIFEPFYTKKVLGRSGTGLGLAVVWNTLQDYDGYINVKTSKKGTVFELYFPATRKKLAVKEEVIPVKDYMGHGERVLVVDDEKRQREVACGILTKLGYDAEAVSSGEEAVEYLKKQTVDLIVLDMIMSQGINGRETYEKIIKIHPKQKAIIASGFSKTVDVKKAQRLGAGKYIKKPYTMEKIGMAVKEELEK